MNTDTIRKKLGKKSTDEACILTYLYETLEKIDRLQNVCKAIQDIWRGFACPICGAYDAECIPGCPWGQLAKIIDEAEVNDE